MKHFKMQHRFVKTKAQDFTEDTPPSWLTSHVYNWWWEDYVLKLNIGESIESDFQKITRVS